MRIPFGKKAKIGAAVLAVILAMTAYDARWGPPACDATATGLPLKPKMIFGLSIGFEPWVKAAFPVGSCEADLIAWMDRVGFGKQNIIYDRDFHRDYDTGILFWSYFWITWTTDEERRLATINSGADLWQFFLFNLP